MPASNGARTDEQRRRKARELGLPDDATEEQIEVELWMRSDEPQIPGPKPEADDAEDYIRRPDGTRVRLGARRVSRGW